MGNRELLLDLLKSEKETWISGETLRERLGISRNAVSKHIKTLREKGYEIESSTNKGYLLHGPQDLLLAEEIRDGLDTVCFGKHEILCFRETDSTNRQAKLLADEGAPEGTLVLAESQTSGRGRKGRSWFTAKGQGIFFSMILRPAMSPMECSRLTLLTAVAMAETLIGITGLEIKIKWPNDLLCGGRKLAGILTELSTDMDAVDHVIIGLGLNVNTPKETFPRELQEIASSVSAESGKTHSRCEILKEFLKRFEELYETLVKKGFSPVLGRWKELSGSMGRRVRVEMIGKEITGIIKDVDSEGVLILEDESGQKHRILSGDVVFL